MIKKMERLNFIQAVSALELLTKPGLEEDSHAIVMDMDERPFMSRTGVHQRRIALCKWRLYDVRITDYDGRRSVWSEPYSPHVKDIFANDWEVWAC